MSRYSRHLRVWSFGYVCDITKKEKKYDFPFGSKKFMAYNVLCLYDLRVTPSNLSLFVCVCGMGGGLADI